MGVEEHIVKRFVGRQEMSSKNVKAIIFMTILFNLVFYIFLR